MNEITNLPAAPANPQPFSLGMPLQPSFDVIDALPAGAADNLRALRDRSSDTHSLIPAFEDIRVASEVRHDAERALKRLTDHRSIGGFELSKDDGRVIAAQRTLDKATDHLKRLQQRQEAKSQAWQLASAALQSAEAWIRDGRPPGTTLRDYAGEVPKLQKGENVLDAIERIRRRSRELKADLARIAAAPYPSNYCKQKMRQEVEQLAQRGAASVSRLVEHDGPVEFPTMQLMVPVRSETPGAVGFAEMPDALALFAWTFKDALVAALDAEIDGESDDPASLSHEAREKAAAEVMADLLSVERDESSLVWQAQAERLPVEHRADVNPLALLGLRLVTAPLTDPSPGSSPQHAYDLVGGRRR